jgi:hypothetical protein
MVAQSVCASVSCCALAFLAPCAPEVQRPQPYPSLTGANGQAENAWSTHLDSRLPRSRYVFMSVQTIGEAHQAGWRIHVRCALGPAGGYEERDAVRLWPRGIDSSKEG